MTIFWTKRLKQRFLENRDPNLQKFSFGDRYQFTRAAVVFKN